MGRFRLFRGNDTQFYWTLKASNHEPILQSEGYRTRAGAENGIEAVRGAAPYDSQYTRLGSGYGAYYFVLRGFNSEVLGRSEMYTTASGRDNGIEAVKREAPTAPVEDQT